MRAWSRTAFALVNSAMPSPTSASIDPSGDPRVPIVLGVTGHRTLPDEERLASKVRAELATLRDRYPHSPFVILSPLAEGADRLVARVAMEEIDARLYVPLPLPIDLYHEDFETETSRSEFDALLEKAEATFELDLLTGREEVAKRGPARDRQYALAGGFVADRCQLLLALWDGKEADGTGGTADVVRWAKDGRVPRQYLPFETRDRPFYYPNETTCIHVEVFSGDVRWLSGGEDAAGILQRIDQYNQDIAAFREKKGTRPLRRSTSRVVGKDKKHEAFNQSSTEGLLAYYAAADTLSIELQGRFRRWVKGIYVVSALAIVSFAALSVWPPAIGLSLLFVALAVGMLARTGRRDLEDRYLHARALAEGLRVAVFWAAGGHSAPCPRPLPGPPRRGVGLDADGPPKRRNGLPHAHPFERGRFSGGPGRGRAPIGGGPTPILRACPGARAPKSKTVRVGSARGLRRVLASRHWGDGIHPHDLRLAGRPCPADRRGRGGGGCLWGLLSGLQVQAGLGGVGPPLRKGRPAFPIGPREPPEFGTRGQRSPPPAWPRGNSRERGVAVDEPEPGRRDSNPRLTQGTRDVPRRHRFIFSAKGRQRVQENRAFLPSRRQP